MRGAADQFRQGKNVVSDAAKQISAETNKITEGIKDEVAELDAKRKEEMRRESKEEGWRSDAFDV